MKSFAKNASASFIKGLFGGIITALGASVYVASRGNGWGILLTVFSFMAAYILGFELYTGKLYHAFNSKPSYLLDTALTAAGNIISVYAVCKIILLTGRAAQLRLTAQSFWNKRMADTPVQSIFSAFMCGVIIALAIIGYNKFKDKGSDFAVAFFLFAVVFILCRFDHALIDLTCFTLARIWSKAIIIKFIYIFFGNTLGAGLVYAFYKALKVQKSK